jgi:CO/xanthine dehydrogenase Mo-binding subunit
VRYVGDPAAMVIAETLAEAKDAAELLEIDYEPLAAVTSTAEAAKPGAPAVWDECPDNVSNVFEVGNRASAEAAFAGAKHVVKRRYVITRVHAQYMEARGAVAVYEPAEDKYTLIPTSSTRTACERPRGKLLHPRDEDPRRRRRYRRRVRRRAAVPGAPARSLGGEEAAPPGEVAVSAAKRCSPTSTRATT